MPREKIADFCPSCVIFRLRVHVTYSPYLTPCGCFSVPGSVNHLTSIVTDILRRIFYYVFDNWDVIGDRCAEDSEGQ
jgi:hypothetical protein